MSHLNEHVTRINMTCTHQRIARRSHRPQTTRTCKTQTKMSHSSTPHALRLSVLDADYAPQKHVTLINTTRAQTSVHPSMFHVTSVNYQGGCIVFHQALQRTLSVDLVLVKFSPIGHVHVIGTCVCVCVCVRL
jgi:hypothetical protein